VYAFEKDDLVPDGSQRKKLEEFASEIGQSQLAEEGE
jgi:hypothetical protein